MNNISVQKIDSKKISNKIVVSVGPTLAVIVDSRGVPPISYGTEPTIKDRFIEAIQKLYTNIGKSMFYTIANVPVGFYYETEFPIDDNNLSVFSEFVYCVFRSFHDKGTFSLRSGIDYTNIKDVFYKKFHTLKDIMLLFQFNNVEFTDLGLLFKNAISFVGTEADMYWATEQNKLFNSYECERCASYLYAINMLQPENYQDEIKKVIKQVKNLDFTRFLIECFKSRTDTKKEFLSKLEKQFILESVQK